MPKASVVVFAIAGIVAGTVSAASAMAPPSHFLFPPVAFGTSICIARGRLAPTTFWFVSGCVLAWLACCLTGMMTLRLGFHPPYDGLVAGSMCGAVGALIIAIAHAVLFPIYSGKPGLWLTVGAGAIAGGFGLSLDIYLNDYAPSSFVRGLALFPIWQTTIAMALAIGEHLDTPGA